ncbi:MAG: head decoration protein [Deltaproteobacteria bacterium]|nr:head decoration protein [Deltaproteobacteria bacterium]
MAGTHGVTEIEATQSQLVAGETHEQKPITLASGQNQVRGTVLGLVTASNEYVQLNPAGADGSQTARAILVEDCNASTAAKKTQGYFTGKYKLSDLIWPGGITDAQKNTAILDMQDRGIIVDEDFV